MSADTIVPGAANPQALNRYSYVLNMPISATDPSGHKCVSEGPGDCTTTTTTGTQIPINGSGSPTNTGNSSSNGGGEDDNWPDDPPWDDYPAPVEWETDSIDVLFDPWAGASYEQAFTDPNSYYDQYYYEEAGLDPRLIVDNATLYGADNPLTNKQASDLMGSLTLRKGWRPYTEFLKALGLGYGPEHITNYEPRFMEGLMVAKKGVLNDVKDTWRLTMADPLMAEMRQFLMQRAPGFTPLVAP